MALWLSPEAGPASWPEERLRPLLGSSSGPVRLLAHGQQQIHPQAHTSWSWVDGSGPTEGVAPEDFSGAGSPPAHAGSILSALGESEPPSPLQAVWPEPSAWEPTFPQKLLSNLWQRNRLCEGASPHCRNDSREGKRPPVRTSSWDFCTEKGLSSV